MARSNEAACETRFYPPLDAWPEAGVYTLDIVVRSKVDVAIGSLGQVAFPPGRYVYTGRASKGLRKRVLRHTSSDKKIQWHIDRLLAQPQAQIQSIVLASDDPEAEFAVNEGAGAHGRCVAPGFGSSDCRRGCEAHLWLIE